MRRLCVVAGLLPLLMLALDARPARASVIVAVGVERSVSATARVRDQATGQELVDPGESFTSTSPFTPNITASAGASLLGSGASSDASSGSATEQDLGADRFSLRITLHAHATAGGSCATCTSSAQSNASLALTFDLIAPVEVEALYTFDVGIHGGGSGSLYQGSTRIASTTPPPFAFVLVPGRYTLQGSAAAAAFVGPVGSGFIPTSDAPLFLSMIYHVVPEPSTGALTLVGLLALAGRRSLACRSKST